MSQRRNKLFYLMMGALSAASLTAQAADSANVTVYGKARASVNSTDNGTDTVTDISTNSSRLGFKGSEDLGDGVKAVFQFETLVNLDDGAGNNKSGGTPTNSLFGAGRNTYVGLGSELGSFILGNYDSPYKEATGRIDILSDTMADYNTIIGDIGDNDTSAEYDPRTPNSINYWSPKMAALPGFGLKLQYRPDENSAVSQDRYSINATYENGPFYAGLGYENHSNEGSTSTRDTQGTKLGLGYTFEEATKVGLVYEKLSEDGASTVFDRNAWYVNVSHQLLGLANKVGLNTLKVAYGHAGANDATADSGADFYAVGIAHNFSKRSEMYLLYAKTNNDTNGRYALGTTGGSGATLPAATGQDVSSLSLGINYDF